MSAREVIAVGLATDRVCASTGDPAIKDGRPHIEFWDDADLVLRALDDAGWDLIERDGPHYIDVTDDGWSTQHPAKCRPDLLGCIFHRCIDEQVRECGEVMVDEPGRYTFGVDDDGKPTFTRVPGVVA